MNESLSSPAAILQILSFLITAYLLAAAFNYAEKGGLFKRKPKAKRMKTAAKRSESGARLRALWQKTLDYAKRGDEDGFRLAIIEADKILDEALSIAGINGLDTSDRLKKITKEHLPNLESVWQVHKLRNRLVHETNFHLPKDLALQALKIYGAAFHSFKILD